MKRHVVIYPHAAQGHVTPMLQLAKVLASRGFTITFVNTEHIISRIHRSQLDSGLSLPQEQGLDIRFLSIPDALPEFHGRTSNLPEVVASIEKQAEPFAKLVEDINSQEGNAPVSCIISDFLHSHTQALADRLGIPRIAFWTPSACAVSACMHSPMLVEKGILPIDDAGDELVTCLPGIHHSPRRDLPAELTEGGFVLGRMMLYVENLRNAAWMIVNTFHELEGPALDGISSHRPVVPIGPLLPASFLGQQEATNSTKKTSRHGSSIWPEDDKCLEWLDTRLPSSVLYISFGSIVKASDTQLQELALGIEASNQPFLWALQQDSRDETVVPFLKEFEARTRDRGIVTGWVPQLLVLSHPSVGAFLTHNGWNSTLESICAGVPMLCWPGFFDQFMNARYVVEVWKVGLSFRKQDGIVVREEVEGRIKELIQDGEEIRERAIKLRDAARRSASPGGSSHENLEKLVAFLSHHD